MAVLVNFLNGVIGMLKDVGNAVAVIALIIYGLKLLLSNDAIERENAKRVLLTILIAIILINAGDKIVQELIALI